MVHGSVSDRLQQSEPFGLIGHFPVLAKHDGRFVVVDEIVVAVDTLFFVARPSVENRSVSQHGPTAVGHVKKVAMAFLALVVVEGVVGGLPSFFPIVIVR
jgi:hypothetical protein